MDTMSPAEKRSSKATERRNRQIALGLRGEPDHRPISPLVLFAGYHDHGPCEPGSPSAFCPHCGSGGRHVWEFFCQDGTRRAAMRGCLKLFPSSKLAIDQMTAIDRFHEAIADQKSGKRKWGPASWDNDIFGITEDLAHGEIDIDGAKAGIAAALDRRRAFLARKGFMGSKRR